MIEKSNMRVLMIVTSLSKGSGVMSVIMNYYRNINRSLIQFDFAYHREVEQSFLTEVIELGGQVFLFPDFSLCSLFANYKSIKSFFSKYGSRFTAIHLHVPEYGFIYMPLAIATGIKHRIVHVHSMSYSTSPLRGLRNRLACIGLMRQGSHFFSCSEVAATFWYGSRKNYNKSYKCLKNAVSYEKYAFKNEIRNIQRSALNIGENTIAFSHIGRFSEEKNHIFLLRVFKLIQTINQRSVLVLVGDGPLRPIIEREIITLGLTDTVILLGVRDDVAQLLQAFDCFILPSAKEGLSLVTLEAQISGLPCLVSSGVPQEVDFTGNVRFLGLERHVDEWAVAALELAKNSRFDVTLKQVAEAGYEISLEAKKLENFYLSLE